MYNEFLRYSFVPSYVRWPPVISLEEAIPTSPKIFQPKKTPQQYTYKHHINFNTK